MILTMIVYVVTAVDWWCYWALNQYFHMQRHWQSCWKHDFIRLSIYLTLHIRDQVKNENNQYRIFCIFCYHLVKLVKNPKTTLVFERFLMFLHGNDIQCLIKSIKTHISSTKLNLNSTFWTDITIKNLKRVCWPVHYVFNGNRWSKKTV